MNSERKLSDAPSVALVLAPAWSTQSLPAGLGTVAANLRRLRCRVEVFDLNIQCWQSMREVYGKQWKRGHPLFWDDQSHASFWDEQQAQVPIPIAHELGQRVRTLIAPILQGAFDVVGFSLFASNLRLSYWMITQYREHRPGARILLGGPSVSDLMARPAVAPGASGNQHLPLLAQWLSPHDAAIPGECESALPHLLRAWHTGVVQCPPKGCITAAEGRLIFNGHCARCDISRMPTLQSEDFDLDAYSLETIPLEVSRGCVGRCPFCAERNLHKGYRARDVEALLQAIRRDYSRGHRAFSFLGSSINGDHEHFSDFMVKLVESGMRISWGGSMRLNPRIDTSYIRLMSKSGCSYFNFGLESAAPAVLEKMNKNIDLSVVGRVIRDASRMGIGVAMNVITGLPGETEADHRQTLAFLEKHASKLNRVHVSPCQLYSGTLLLSEPSKYGIGTVSSPHHWVSVDCDNTPEIRQRRVAEIIHLLNSIGVPWLAPFGEESRTSEDIATGFR